MSGGKTGDDDESGTVPGMSKDTQLTIDNLAAALSRHHPALLPSGASGRAGVAAILHEAPSGARTGAGLLRLLFIERATREGDPWSGHIAFPGGMMERGDAGIRATAVRETLEEVGLDLAAVEPLGRLDDLRGRPLPIIVSALVFRVSGETAFARGPEVKEAFWMDVEELYEPARRTSIVRRRDGVERTLPAIRMTGGIPPRENRPPLWGLTYQLVANLVTIAGRPL